DIKDTLKKIFKTEKFEENTWHAYAKNLSIWFGLSNLHIKMKLEETKRGKGSYSVDKTQHIPYYSPSMILESYTKLLQGKSSNYRVARDLYLFGLIDEKGEINSKIDNIHQHLYNEAL